MVYVENNNGEPAGPSDRPIELVVQPETVDTFFGNEVRLSCYISYYPSGKIHRSCAHWGYHRLFFLAFY